MKERTPEVRVYRWLCAHGYTPLVKVVSAQIDPKQPKYCIRVALAIEWQGERLAVAAHNLDPESAALKAIARIKQDLSRLASGKTLNRDTSITQDTALVLLDKLPNTAKRKHERQRSKSKSRSNPRPG